MYHKTADLMIKALSERKDGDMEVMFATHNEDTLRHVLTSSVFITLFNCGFKDVMMLFIGCAHKVFGQSFYFSKSSHVLLVKSKVQTSSYRTIS